MLQLDQYLAQESDKQDGRQSQHEISNRANGQHRKLHFRFKNTMPATLITFKQ